jgi:hypothetical protein
MIPYYSRKFDAASVGVRLVNVLREKCRCIYYYELARIGSGSASAPYAIGSKGAARRSTEQAGEDLERRLAEEAELVPCPRCHWINEVLVSGYRRGRYRSWGKLAAGIGCVGTIIPLLIAMVLSNGPAADRGAVPYFLVGGPSISISLAALLFFGRNWLRSRIDPNKGFPHPPTKLPRGSPTPLIKNPTTGELEAVRPKRSQDPLADEWVDFQAGREESSADEWVDYQIGRSQLPPACTDCLSPSNPQSADRRTLFQAVVLVLPRCASCARRRKRAMWKNSVITLSLTMAVAIPVMSALKVDEIVFWVCVAGLGSVVPLIGIIVGDRLTTPVRVKLVDRSRGIVRLWFRNEDYRKLIQMYGGLS